MTGEEKGGGRKQHVSIQTNRNRLLLHTGSFAASSLAMFSSVPTIRHMAGRITGTGGGRGWESQCRTRYSQEVTFDPQWRSESCLPEGLNAATGSGYDYLSLPR